MQLADPIHFRARWPVRSYELDSNGHVNNSVYLSWAEEIATMHAEAAGYGRDWTLAQGGLWVIHRSEITHRRPAVYGDVVDIEVRVELLKGARAVRRTWIRREADGELLCEVVTDWAWVRAADGRPARVTRSLIELAESSPYRKGL